MAAITASGAVSVTDEVNPADTSTGALIVAGGVAVAKNCNVGGTLGVTGASTLDGAVDINAAADISGTLTLSKDSGTGLAVTKNRCWWYLGVTGASTMAAITASGAVSVNDDTQSADTSTGALIVAGGVAVAKNCNVGGNLTVTGDLTVSGTTTTVNSNEVNIGDNIIVLNSDETGDPSQDAGIEIERGTADNKKFIWDESEDYWSTEGEAFNSELLLLHQLIYQVGILVVLLLSGYSLII